MRQIDTLRRRNYEAYAALGWLLAIPAAVLLANVTLLPKWPFLVNAGIGAFMLLFRGALAIRFWLTLNRLAQADAPFQISLDKLRQIVHRHKKHIYLGRGFLWSQPHTQKVYDIMKGDLRDFMSGQVGSIGIPWVHNVGEKDVDILFPISHSEGHTFIVGTTGAGKTTLFRLLITQAILRDEAVIIFDPKGDAKMLEVARQCCQLLGQPDRFVYFHPAFPEHSARIDAIHNFNRASELASRIAALIPSETYSDPFKAFSQKSLDNIVQAILTIETRPTLVSLRRYLEGGAANLVIQVLEQHFMKVIPDWRSRIRKRSDPEALASDMVTLYRRTIQNITPDIRIEGLLSLFEHDRTHFNKMVASLLPVMNMLTVGDMAYLLSPGADPSHTAGAKAKLSTDLARIISQNQVAYIALDSLSDSMTGSAIGSLLLSDLASVAGDRYNYGAGDRIINIFVDEAAEVVNDPFIQVLNKGRGAGMRLFVASQTFSDFVARMGSKDKAQQILGNMNNLIALRVLDSDTQKYVMGNLPKTRIQYIMRIHGSSSVANNPAVFTGAASERLMEEEVDMVPPQILGMLPNFHYFGKLSGGRIVKGKLPIIIAE